MGESPIYRGGLGSLATWHFPGGPVGPPSMWAATSTVEVRQTTYPVNRRKVLGWRVEKGARDRVTETRTGNEGVECGGNQLPLARDGGLYLDICAGTPEFLVTPLLMGPVCLLSQGRFEEPVRSCRYSVFVIVPKVAQSIKQSINQLPVGNSVTYEDEKWEFLFWRRHMFHKFSFNFEARFWNFEQK